ncbi:two-component system, sensor histidine kinase RegB [Paracoccus aminovorans]|uniref:histidine kinase n=1 Tax=Paracoccus aminovorans TaxID=34004 RepID=A0A1I3D5R9_9RHOB|nr:ActS/PrrB/RegB family redox-sensitive histidine kinase [Paracoccus aminovorans]CQR84932.1 sensor histidine kinase regB [Paracoccus aminovorans]SFH82070.1 two-component system, sensor histidine kinase RegB [Paracoccus aminovorans]
MSIGLVSRRIDLLPGQPGPEPIRLRTLILLRWVAIAGQLAAVGAALAIGAEFSLVRVLGVIGLAVALNLSLSLRPGRRITGREAAWQLGFDLAQIAALLALTGGLENPFALLLLAPVTIAATALPGRHLLALGTATFVMVTLAAVFAQPLSFHATRLSLQYPLLVGHWFALVIGALFFSSFARLVAAEVSATSDALFAARMALEREQKLQHLGGVVAAAAHELGTPLATIKLVSAELSDELSDALPEREDLAEDLALLRQSADRCRDILKSMGGAGRDDLLIRSAPLSEVLSEAAAPHRDRGAQIEMQAAEENPIVHRDAAVIHGLRNLIQNAVDFASDRVTVQTGSDRREIWVRIIDDGPGFPPALLPRIGSPFLTTRPRAEDGRSYEGMGLGLFIAKALLERSGARLRFGNGARGAEITVIWPRTLIEADNREALGPNPQILG